MNIQFHQIGFVRRLAASVAGSLVAVALYSVGEDVHGAVRAMAQSVPPARLADDYQAKVERVKAFADTLKSDGSAAHEQEVE